MSKLFDKIVTCSFVLWLQCKLYKLINAYCRMTARTTNNKASLNELLDYDKVVKKNDD